jgi:MICOS complex subunit MIC19
MTDTIPLQQTDGSRARLVELQIQARVAEELRNLQRKESEALAAAHDKIASAEVPAEDNSASRFTVGKQVDDLRKLLEGRKQVRALPDEVEAARGDVVRCLTTNDRRPLDCWQEVEKFKAEVKKLESTWVDKITS